ncbi:MAG TPA: hypothetical protein VFX15_01770 [Actinomycetes bacterium]|nr:hypothetical protein [Actinomycetes bacterium]
MCVDAPHDHDHEHGISRRRFMALGAGAAAGTLIPATLSPPEAEAVAALDAARPFSMAMHIHSSFSEGWASMSQHLDQATKNGVKVIWWTDHDFRMSGNRFKNEVHFTSLTNETGQGGRWEWKQRTTGPLTAGSSGQIVQTPASPNDPVAQGSLSITATSQTSELATLGFFADSHPAGWNYQTNLFGQVFTIDVRPTSIGTNAFLELLIGTSYHPATNGRPAGQYTVSYRIGGDRPPGTRVTQGIKGIVYVAATPNQWNTIEVTPSDDIALLWPDLEHRDFASNAITLLAGSTGATASGYFDYLRFRRPKSSGNIPLRTQQRIKKNYLTKYPSVAQRPGLEMGEPLPHLSWFGDALTLADYSNATGANYIPFIKERVQEAHAAGGLVSYNHPYGYTSIGLLSQAQQDANRASYATTLLNNRALGTDIIEVGYRSRAGMDLAHHVGLWDILSRNALFMTANGTTDDHAGTNWLTINNNWVTSVWAPNKKLPSLLTALRAGRAWTSSLSGFKGQLDVVADGTIPMGSVSVSSVNQRQVTLLATGMPAGSTLRVIRGTVDYAGTADPTPSTQVIATYTADQLSGGEVSLNVDTTTSRFVRTEVRNSSGTTIAVSNPVWLLRQQPPNGIPAARAA